MKDEIVRATALGQHVNLLCATTTHLVDQTQKIHRMWPTSLATLGRIETVTAMMASQLKGDDERIIVTINGGGPIGTCMAEATSQGQVRGFVGDNEIYLKYNDSNKLAVGLAVGQDGYLSVTKDLSLKETFTGKVALQSGEIGDDFAYYFALSEQIPSVVSVGVLVDVDYSCKAAGGLLIQMMPDAKEEDIRKVEAIAASLAPISSLIDQGKTPDEIILSLFDDATILDHRSVELHCGCDKERFRAALTTLPEKDLKEMLEEDKGCSVKCDYCENEYTFNEEELRSILRFKNPCFK